jgi:ectoine hydroxylase-related dioxygenase (phytanoyl-CoA dioxygenase family)
MKKSINSQQTLSPFDGRAFEERGYVVLRGLLEPAVVAGVRDEMARLVDGLAAGLVEAGTIPHGFHDEPLETRMIRLYERNLDQAPKHFRENLHLKGLFPLFFHARLLDVVAQILGPEIRLYPNYTARPKLPEWSGTEVLWHQDGGYTAKLNGGAEEAVTNMRMVNVWTPLVPARVVNGCMQFVPGSHRLGVVAHEQREHYLEIAPLALKPHLPNAISIEVDPGDVVLFHNLLFHCGLPNHAKTIRWSLDWRYQDATQPTQRPQRGHMARSARSPTTVVRSAEEWARLTFI